MVCNEGDATTYFHDEVVAVMRAAFSPLGEGYRIVAQHSSGGNLKADLVCFQLKLDDKMQDVLLELKRPGYINKQQWDMQDFRYANKHIRKLTRKIRRFGNHSSAGSFEPGN